MVKKVDENWDIINKNGHSTFHTCKPGNFNSLREVSAKRSVMVIKILQMICIGHVLEAPGLYEQTLL